MHKVKIEAELSDEFFRAYQREAERKGVKVEELVEKMVNGLIDEVEHEEEDHPIWVS